MKTSFDPVTLDALASSLAADATLLEAANRHRTAAQATLTGPVADSYDALRRGVYQDGVLNVQAIRLKASSLVTSAQAFEEAEAKAEKGSEGVRIRRI